MRVIFARVALFSVSVCSTHEVPHKHHTLSAAITVAEALDSYRDERHVQSHTRPERGRQHDSQKNGKPLNGMGRLMRKEPIHTSARGKTMDPSSRSLTLSIPSLAEVPRKRDTSSGNEKKIDLSGGLGGETGQKTYTAPDGTVVESSAKVYNNSDYYFMSYLFDGSTAANTTTCGANGNTHACYWLTDGANMQKNAEAEIFHVFANEMPEVNGTYLADEGLAQRVSSVDGAWAKDDGNGACVLRESGNNRWIIFNDAAGVSGHDPYFQTNSGAEEGWRGPWFPGGNGKGALHLMTDAADQTLTITLPRAKYLTKVRVRPIPFQGQNRRSNYKIETQVTASGDLTDRSGGFIDTSAMTAGEEKDTDVKANVLVVKFTLTQEDRYGVCLDEIELYEGEETSAKEETIKAQSADASIKAQSGSKSKSKSIAVLSAQAASFRWALLACVLTSRASAS